MNAWTFQQNLNSIRVGLPLLVLYHIVKKIARVPATCYIRPTHFVTLAVGGRSHRFVILLLVVVLFSGSRMNVTKMCNVHLHGDGKK
jgi:hypothetical protein